MNKQLTKKTIGIAASAALMASVAFSGIALADHKPNHQPNKASISVNTWCEIAEGDEAKGDMSVHIRIEDNTSGNNNAVLQSVVVEAASKSGGKDFDTYINSRNVTSEVGITGYFMTPPVKINLCTGADFQKAINAKTTVILANDVTSKAMYTAQCGNNPGPNGILGDDDDVSQSGLKSAEYPDLCSAPPPAP